MDKPDVFFPEVEIKSDRWNKVFPYRLLIWDVKNNKAIESLAKINKTKPPSLADQIPSGKQGFRPFTSTTIANTYFQNGSDYILTQTDYAKQAVFELPITPQQLQITDQYAINSFATARGIVEEHNGVKFKTIVVQASTGVLSQRKSDANLSFSSPSIFGGTLNAVSNVASSFSTFTGFSQSNPLKDADKFIESQTGYYKALELNNFLELYANAKKDPNNSHLRLVFDIPKQNQSYIVTPVNFQLKKSAQSPNEFIFTLQLKAWKRIELNTPVDDNPISLTASFSTDNFTKFVNGIQDARKVIANSVNVVKAVRSDFQRVFDVIRQTTAVVKDLAGLVLSCAELPGQILTDASSAIDDAITNLREAGKTFGQAGQFISNIDKDFSTFSNSIDNLFHNDKSSGGASTTLSAIKSAKSANEGITPKPTAPNTKMAKSVADAADPNPPSTTSDAGQEQGGSSSPQENQEPNDDSGNKNITGENPLQYAIDNAEANVALFTAIQIDKLQGLSQKIKNDIEDEQTRLSLITKDNLLEFKSEIMETVYLISNRYGAGDATLATVYNKSTPSSRSTPLTIEEIELTTAFMEIVQIIDQLTATQYFDKSKLQSPLEYVGALANNADITFGDASAKKLMPVPFGLTIEQIAARYLGNSNRWVEIVTLNNLLLPYIDEEGFTYPLLSNGIGRQINVNDQEQKLYLGQNVILSSIYTPPFSRKIINIEKISDTNYLISLDGENDLDVLTTSDNAQLKAYAAGTVNSQNQIFIPTDEAAEPEDYVTLPRAFQEDKLAKISKIDWLLDANGDVAINKIGDIQLAGGLTNLVQALKLKIKTKKGTLLQHLNYGLGITHGVSVADIENGELLSAMQNMITEDPRFASINTMTIALKGSTLTINIDVTLANNTGILPITFAV